MNSQLLLLLAILMPGAVVQAPPEAPSPPPPPDTEIVAHVPAAGEASAPVEGRRLFVRYQCPACHGAHGWGGSAPSLRDAASVYGDGPEELFASIAHGRRDGMPAWGSIAPPEDIWKLVAYLASLRTTGPATGVRSEPSPTVRAATGPDAS